MAWNASAILRPPPEGVGSGQPGCIRQFLAVLLKGKFLNGAVIVHFDAPLLLVNRENLDATISLSDSQD